MTVPHRIVCHIKMAISGRTTPDMGWRRAPLAAAYAALRQRKEAWLKGPAGSRTGSLVPLLFSFRVPCVLCVLFSSSQASHKLQGLQLRSKACFWTVGLAIPPSTDGRLDLQPRRMLGPAGASLDKGGREVGKGACHRPDSFVPNASTSRRGNGWCR